MIGASLFAGIGGFDLAMYRSGIYVSTAVEIDTSCQGVLRRHFPATDVLGDIREVRGDDLGQGLGIDIIAAGWPCQGNSVAGRRGGMGDPRSGLWGEVARLLGETRPQWFLGENVPGLLTVNRGRDFGIILQSLDELGYGVAWRVLDAQHFGVPQRRKRVLVAGCLGDPAGAAEVLFEPESGGGDSAPGREAPQGRHARTATVSTLQGGGRRGYRVDAEGACGGHLIPVVVGTLDAHDGPHGHGGANVQSALAGHYIPFYDPYDPAQVPALPAGVRRLTPLECERLQGFPDDWTRWLADGREQSDSARYRQLGNAVAVPVVQWLAARIVHHKSTGSIAERAA